MQAIDFTIKVLLLNDNSATSTKIEQLLREATAYIFQVNKFHAVESAGEFLQNHRPDFILATIDLSQRNSLYILSKLQAYNTRNIPLIPILSQDFRSDFLPQNIASYLTWGEISNDLPSKVVWLALKQGRHRSETVERENGELCTQLIATKNLFAAIVDSTSTLIWMCDASGNSTFFNRAWSKLFGRSVTITNNDWMLNVDADDLPRCQQQFKQALAEATGFTIDYRVWSSDRLLAQITRKIHASLELEEILQTTADELNRFLLADKIQINRVDEESRLILLFESKLVGQIRSCNILEVRQVPQRLFAANIARLSAGQIVVDDDTNSRETGNTRCRLLVPISCKQKLWGVLCVEQYSTHREWKTEEIDLIERVALELSVAIVQAKLYQQLEEANRELEQLSIVDSLTQVANRRKFDSYLAAEWNRAAREQTPLSLILCDIDHFKPYNDTYGHQEGDRCLEQVARAISQVFKRPADLVARYGGEEFAVILPNTPLNGAEYLAQQIRWRINALKIPHIASDTDLYLTLSLGVSCCIPNPNNDSGTLVAAADRGLYRAKELGRNRVVTLEVESE